MVSIYLRCIYVRGKRKENIKDDFMILKLFNYKRNYIFFENKGIGKEIVVLDMLRLR